MKRGVFLDRDGTVIQEQGYLGDPEGVVLIQGAVHAIRLFHHLRLSVVLVSNQSGVARGYFPASAVDGVHKRLRELLAREGGVIDRIYYCPHHPDDGCRCRKPQPGMLQQGANDLGLDLSSCYMIGDKVADIEAMQRVGGKGVLVLTGHGERERDGFGDKRPDFVAYDILEAAYWILWQEVNDRRNQMSINKELLEILACPKCKGDIYLTKKEDGLICKACKLVYPIKDDIPVMLIDEALPYKGEE